MIFGSLIKIIWPVFLMSVVVIVFLCTSTENDNPLVDEIRAVMDRNAFPPPLYALLDELHATNIDKGLRNIDPYSRYYPPPISSMDSPSPLHIGINVFFHQSRFWIRTVPGGKADLAGMPEIAKLHSINGEKISDQTLTDLSDVFNAARAKGETALTVSAVADGTLRTFWLTPDSSSSISWMRIGSVIVVNIREFIAHETAPRLQSLYEAMEWEVAQVIIDLRGCNGGDLFEAIEIAGMFVPNDLPMVRLYSRSRPLQTYYAPSGTKISGPMALLIDRYTASAAEIFAGILQYHQITRLSGEKSFGKCLSQRFVTLSNGGKLRFTNIAVMFPDLTSCTGKGLQPDIVLPDVMMMKRSDILSAVI